MTITQYYVDPAIAGNSGTGTLGDPYGDLQYALNTITRDATNGDQINVKAGTAEVLAAGLTLATYGTPTTAAPLVIRGYTSAANDGGRGVISGGAGGFDCFAARYADISLVDMRFTNVGTALSIIQLGARCNVINCEIDTGSNANCSAITSNTGCFVTGCYIHDAARGIQTGYGPSYYTNNYIVPSGTAQYGIYCNGTSADGFFGNIIRCSHTGAYGYYANNTNVSQAFSGNVIYNTAAGTTAGLFLNDNAAGNNQMVVNNIVVGWSGTGGIGIKHDGHPGVIGFNAFYNNTTAETYALTPYVDLGNDVTLAADPFTDAANGDFSLTDAAKAALRSLGWPAAYLGAHANTDAHITIGPLQYGPTPAAGGGGNEGVSRARVLGGY